MAFTTHSQLSMGWVIFLIITFNFLWVNFFPKLSPLITLKYQLMGVLCVYLGNDLTFETDSTSQPTQLLWKPLRFISNLTDGTSEVSYIPLGPIAMHICSYLHRYSSTNNRVISNKPVISENIVSQKMHLMLLTYWTS